MSAVLIKERGCDETMANVIAAIILTVLIGGAAVYLIRAKRNGVKCVGCPAGGKCPSQRKRKRKKLSGPIIAKKTMIISGMHCEHCVQSVTDSLNQIDGVSAKVDLAKGWAEVSLDCQVKENILIAAVEKEGFSVNSIQNEII